LDLKFAINEAFEDAK
jgi:hypothetical protein